MFVPIYDSLITCNDDTGLERFAGYVEAKMLDETFRDRNRWLKMSIENIVMPVNSPTMRPLPATKRFGGSAPGSGRGCPVRRTGSAAAARLIDIAPLNGLSGAGH